MLIVPLSGHMSLKNPPAATIAIVLINCFIFFSIQSGDRVIYEEAMDYYLKSGLAVIEIKAHEQYKAGGVVKAIPPEEVDGHSYTHREILARAEAVNRDRDFRDALDQGRVIKPDNPVHGLWKEKHDRFKEILSKTSVMTYGFTPASWSIKGAFTHMFMHGGFMHLLGNMVFLWLAGCVIELAWGRAVFIALYIAGGLFSVALYGLVYHAGTTPLVGASGAIAALMGAYAVLYGRRSIRIFYSLGFYFNYTLVPGFIILGFWIGNEFLQLFFGAFSQVAYVAHIGGFSSGAVMGHLSRRSFALASEKAVEQDPKERLSALLDEAMKRVEILDVAGARTVLEKVLRIDPNNRTALTQMYHLDKMNTNSDAFHESARRILTNLLRDKQAHAEMLSVYQEYIQKAQSPRLPAGLLISVMSYFASTGHEDEAEKVVGMILKKNPDMPRMPEVLLHLARACIKKGLWDKARSFLQIICIRYPHSSESAIARRILDDQG